MSQDYNKQIQKSIVYLALGLGLGAATAAFFRKNKSSQSIKSQQDKKDFDRREQGVEEVISSQKEGKLEYQLETEIFQKQEQFLIKRNSELRKMISMKPSKHKQQNRINQALEQSEVHFCKVNSLQEMYEGTQVYMNPLYPKNYVPIQQQNSNKDQNLEGGPKEGKSQDNLPEFLVDDEEQFTFPRESFIETNTFVIQERYFQDIVELKSCYKFLRAGAMKEVVFKPQEVKAAIVTCGGLCPGLNVVIKSVVECLYFEYGVREIWGIKWGYRGFYEDDKYWVPLNDKNVKGIQNLGGTILGSSRGGFDGPKMIDALVKRGINQLYVIGGDGTHRGIQTLQQQLREKNIKISICGIPKTIDNDIPLIDRSFGFNTAVAESIKFIDSAQTEAESAEYGVGIIRLMGRYCGYIAVNATLASRDVNICLIPEVHFQLYGPDGVYQRIIERAQTRGHCLVVIAEGAEDGLIDEERELMRKQMGVLHDKKDESGNVKSVDLAKFVVTDLAKYAKENHSVNLTIKYLNPTYAIRTTPANGGDTDLCHRLAHTAVHCIQAGYTDFSIGQVRNYAVMIPLKLLIDQSTRQLKRNDNDWQRLIQSTGQPNFLSKENLVKYLAREKDIELERKEKYLKIKMEILNQNILTEAEQEKFLGISSTKNY